MTITAPATRSEHDRLKSLLPNPRSRWASESIHLAQEALRYYAGDRLDSRQAFHGFFRANTPDLYARAHDIASASRLLEILIREETGDA